MAASAGATTPKPPRLSKAVPVSPFEQRLDRVDGLIYARMKVAKLGEPRGYGRDRELPRVDVVDLIPADRRRDGGLWHPAYRVSAGDCVIPGVLVVVDEQLLRVTVLAPPGRRRLIGSPALDLARERPGRAAQVSEPPAWRYPHVNMQAVAA